MKNDPADILHHISALVSSILNDGLNEDEKALVRQAFEKPINFNADWSLWDKIKETLGESCRMIDDFNMLPPLHERLSGNRLLDFGCGATPHRELIENFGYKWHGLDVKCSRDPGSSSAAHRLEGDPRVTFYDGFQVPLESSSYDVIYAHQSLEHVHDCNLSFAEMARVLKPGGFLVGSVSHMEPYHGYSTYNYTPYGFKIICERSGFAVEMLRAGADVFTLALRSVCNMFGALDVLDLIDQKYFYRSHSPLNNALLALNEDLGRGIPEVSTAMLHLCGQFVFLARKM